MKTFLTLAVLVAAATVLTGCATIGPLQMFPTVLVDVVNNCKNSYLVIHLPDGGEKIVRYPGIAKDVPVRSYNHLSGIQGSFNHTSKRLTVQAWGFDKVYLGSASRPFNPGYQGRASDEYWEINDDVLRGGERRCS